MMRLLAAAAALVAAGVAAAVCGASTGASCAADYRADVTIEIGSQKIAAEKAETPEERDRGLSGRPCIRPDVGMLFTFAKPIHISFWMQGMKFPLDIVWIGADHRAVWIERRLQPSTYPRTFKNKGKAAQYVLELQAGRAKSLGLVLGTRLRF